MDKNNAKDFLQFVQALAEGKTIQCKGRDGYWNDMKYNISFDSDPELYRIKPETTKWWIIPENTALHNDEDYDKFGPCYHVAEQEDYYYSKSCPPLKSGFDSKEEAEKWLNNYLLEESVFNSAARRFDIFSAIMSDYTDRFKNHKQLEKECLEFKVHEFLEDVQKMDESLWTKDKEKGE